MNPQQIGVGGRHGIGEVVRDGDSVAQKKLVDQPKFLGWKNVRAQVQVVAGMINDLERQHVGYASLQLVFAFENEIGQRKQRASVFRFVVAACMCNDAGFSARRVVVGEAAGAVQRA